ncbi:DUF350 domain-containing protein [Corynebacterium uterequi]|nr:DUF350 domain-containing protein [Corynebacterium uterequi]
MSTVLFEITSTLAYFGLAAVLLLLGFALLDVLTPGKLYALVFLDHNPNAGTIAAGQQVAIGLVLITTIYHSVDLVLWQGLLEFFIYGLLGIVLQAVGLVILEALIPGRFRNIVEDPKPRFSARVVAVILVVVGAINAACLI